MHTHMHICTHTYTHAHTHMRSQACKFVPGSELIMMDATEAVEKLRLTLRVLGAFKNYYFEYRAKSSTETPDNLWKFQVSGV